MIIAIDGIGASGKGTLSSFLAKHYGCEVLHTGDLYRLVARKLLEQGIDTDEFVKVPSAEGLADILKCSVDMDNSLRSDEISQYASKIAKISEIRRVLTEFQREWVKNRKVAVVEGRDIGTVVCPQADVKLFLVADANVRAKRRMQQLSGNDSNESEEEVYANLIERDARDKQRDINPLKMANDAILLDTTNLTVDKMQEKALELIEKKIDNSSRKV